MQDIDQRGSFYLGKDYDFSAGKVTDKPLLYDSKDLTTHGVIVGMTGSGKTGLAISLLEEAALDGIPAIAIDPKGDLGNLLLTFPNLTPEDFRPWVDPAEAARKGVTPEQFAEQTAKTWREGLAAWGQTPERIAQFKNSVDAVIYTPGSTAGRPLTVLRSFAAPDAKTLEDVEALRDRIASAVGGLLGLLGVTGDPLRSREHILLSNLLDHAWRAGRDLDLGGLIREIQQPPFEKVGFVDLENFFPAKERFELAMSLNSLLASPGFAAWMSGEPLDIQKLLYTPEGKPRLAILSIAHLSDAERMFFVTLLLNEVISWMRAQAGTSGLRALLYMDEVFGYFPPTVNPPSKTPMLTLLKQARAYGLGVVLATQNPVDLDYKGLSNAGTWMLGRLQTERDKMRVLDGLEGASSAAGATFDRRKLESVLSGLGNRVFLMNNVHDDQPVVFQSRWALSYLRGPLTREQIQQLTKSRGDYPATMASAGPSHQEAKAAASQARPVLPPDVPEAFVAPRIKISAGQSVKYRPMLLGNVRMHFTQARPMVDQWQELSLLANVEEPLDAIWESAEKQAEEVSLDQQPVHGATFASLPSELTRAKSYAGFASDLKDQLYRTHRLSLLSCAAHKQVSQPDEDERDFRTRLGKMIGGNCDAQIAKIKTKYDSKIATLEERIRKAEQKVEKEKSQVSSSKFQAFLAFITSIIAALFGRKLMSTTNVTRAGSSITKATKVSKEQADVTQAQENVESLQQQLADLQAKLEEEQQAVRQEYDADAIELETVELTPKKTEINITQMTLVWTPWRVSADGIAEKAY